MELPSKKYLNLAAIKALVAGAEAEAVRKRVRVTICVVDEEGGLLFLQKGDRLSPNTLKFAKKKARHAALFGKPSKLAAETVKSGSVETLVYPNYFPNQGGVPIFVDGQILGGMAASGASSETDELIVLAGINSVFPKKTATSQEE